MVLYSWLKRREIGLKNNIGAIDNIHKTVYTSFKSNDCWNDCSCGASEHGGVFNLEFSLDGSILVAACERKSIVLLDPTSAKTIKTVYNAHSDCVNCVKFLDERMFATCSDDTTVAIWDTRNLRTKVKSLNGHSNWVKNIEYSKKDELLVTSGFDGSVFAWDINSSTENGFVYQKVFHTAGLMRCRVSPDANRLVICTTCGYLIIIHNLDLTTLAEDLDGFRPNMFRLMQISNQYYPCVGNYKHIFSSNNQRNKVEFIIDFPKGNDAEVVSSLQIHPQGWCALSRNMSYDEESEWTCIHDIQEAEPEKPENESDYLMDLDADLDESSSLEETTNVTASQPVVTRNFRPIRNNTTRSNNNISTNNNPSVNISNVNRENCPPDIWAAEISITNRANRLRTPSSPSHVYGISSGIIRPQSIQQPTTLPDQKRYNIITKNNNRLLFYAKEPNKGKGFIKELCFSSDGRVICSPYNFGIRLLAFNKECSELPNALRNDNKANEMSPIKIIQSHSDIVVSAKFSPKQPLLVSGCLQGKVVWHYPVL